MIYLDSSIVIDGTDVASPLFASISNAVQALGRNERGVSEIVRLECLVQPTRNNDSVRIARLESYLSGLVDLPLVRADRQGLKTPDALHLATAIHHGCAEFWTNDRDFLKIPVGLTFRTFWR